MGIDAYYDQSMFEDPWKDLLPPQEGENSEVHVLKKEGDEPQGTEDLSQVKEEEAADSSQGTSQELVASPKLANVDVCGGSGDNVTAVT